MNSLVHILMYAYYTIAATGSAQTKNRIKAFKKYITIIQMVPTNQELCDLNIFFCINLASITMIGELQVFADKSTRKNKTDTHSNKS